MPTKQQQESFIRKCLKSEISTLISIVVATVAFVGWFYANSSNSHEEIAMIKKDIEIINTNHLTHIQNDIAELKEDGKKNATDHSEIDKKLERILTILETK
jgi:hypothetical protein